MPLDQFAAYLYGCLIDKQHFLPCFGGSQEDLTKVDITGISDTFLSLFFVRAIFDYKTWEILTFLAQTCARNWFEAIHMCVYKYRVLETTAEEEKSWYFRHTHRLDE